MASNYPGSLDSFDTIASDKKTSDAVGGRTHRAMHNDLGDAIEAVQTELGTDPAGAFATVKARLDALVAYAAKTSAYTATVADHTLNVTSGTFTLDLPAASTCTGQSLRVKNSGTGVVTLDGNSSETVDGVATFPLGPKSYVEVTSTGSAWILTGGVPDSGLRNIGAALTPYTDVTIHYAHVRRTGHVVSLSGDCTYGGSTTAAAVPLFAEPAGFTAPMIPIRDAVAASAAVTPEVRALFLRNADVMLYGATGSTRYRFAVSYHTNDAWPTSLPGSAA